MSEWKRTDEALPEPGKYVLARHNRGTWHDSDDQENVNCVVVKLVCGISMKERGSLSISHLESNRRRSMTWCGEDEQGNNRRPYNWDMFGPDSFFGQSITHWMEIPK